MRETNREAERVHAEWNAAHPDNQKQWTPVTIVELKAFIGLLLLAGVNRSHMEQLRELWSPQGGRPIFCATMSLNRFKALLRYLRFDNKNTRAARREHDKLAAFRDIWEMFIPTLRKHYIPGPDMTVDEQLVPFRGKCPFRQYIPSKPAKYGIKVWWNCDAITSYPLKGEIYLGRQPGEDRQAGLGATVVKNTTGPWLRSGRNIVCDNFFTSVPLAEELLLEHTTIVGTMRKNKAEIPPEMQANNQRPIGSSMFGFAGNLTIASYVPSKGKAVIMLSTMHHDASTEGDAQKPEIVLHYNANKSGVDNMDHLATIFSCKRKTNRWPMVLFYNMLDVAGVAAFVIWISLNPDWSLNDRKGRRRKFLKQLGQELIEDYIQVRLQNPRVLKPPVWNALKMMGKLPGPPQPAGAQQPAPQAEHHPRKRCKLCPTRIDRKTSTVCNECNRNVCPTHSSKVIKCVECQ